MGQKHLSWVKDLIKLQGKMSVSVCKVLWWEIKCIPPWEGWHLFPPSVQINLKLLLASCVSCSSVMCAPIISQGRVGEYSWKKMAEWFSAILQNLSFHRQGHMSMSLFCPFTELVLSYHCWMSSPCPLCNHAIVGSSGQLQWLSFLCCPDLPLVVVFGTLFLTARCPWA